MRSGGDLNAGDFNARPVARQIMNYYYFGNRTFSSPTLPLLKGVK